MNNKRYLRKYLRMSGQKTWGKVGISLFKAATLATLTLSSLSIGEAIIDSNKTTSEKLASQRAAFAQEIKIDGTTKTTVDTLPSPDGDGFSIVGGTLRGRNLFHSFDTFSPGASDTLFDLSDSAYDAVNNVFNRVTGNGNTFINGSLQLIGGDSPNFFLLNPNGISLGTGARLDVPASFFATTAEQISFSDGAVFSAADTAANPLLTISAPVGLQFGAKAAPISWSSDGIPSGSDEAANAEEYSNSTLLRPNVAFTLLGGETSLENVGITTSSGFIQIGSVAAGTALAMDTDSHTLTYGSDTEYQDVSIRNSQLDTSVSQNLDLYEGGSGDVSIRGRNITLNTTNLDSDNVGPADGGATEVRATEQLAIADSRITTTIFIGYDLTPSNGLPYTLYPSAGRGGDIYLEARELSVLAATDDGTNLYDTKIGADTYSDGDAGNIVISAETVNLLGDDRRVGLDASLPSVRVVSNSFERGDGGSISIKAGDMTAYGNTVISSSNYSAEGSEEAPGAQSGTGGNIFLDIKDSLRLENGAAVVTVSLSDGDAGSLVVKAGDITMIDQDIDPNLSERAMVTQMNASSYEDGNGGDITIETNSLTMFGSTSVVAASLPGAPLAAFGEGGSLSINADTMTLENGANLRTSTYTDGDAGALNIVADSLTMAGKVSNDPATAHLLSYITTGTFFSDGTGGDITLDVDRLTIEPGAQIEASTFGTGNAGEVLVNASERIDVDGVIAYSVPGYPERVLFSGIFNAAEFGSSGNGGNLTITTPQLTLTDGGSVSTRTAGLGNAGNVTVRADDVLVSGVVVDPFDNALSGITATVSTVGAGTGGQVDIESDRLRVYNGGQITASTDGAGNAGNIDIYSDVVEVKGVSVDGVFRSSIASRSTTPFDAGSVEIAGSSLSVREGGVVSVSSLSGGNAGNVGIAVDTAYLSEGRIEAEASSGSQGNVGIFANDVLLLRRGSEITTNATETATGGNVTLNAPIIAGLENSDISANAVEGDGGNIKLITQGLIGFEFRDQLTDQSDITASSDLGVSGTIEIESPDVDTDSGLVKLPENLEDASDQVAASCATQEGNRFASTGRGGLPNNPLNHLSSNRPWQDFRIVDAGDSLVSAGRIKQPPEATVTEVLQEAGDWQISADGEVELIAQNNVKDLYADCLAHTTAAL